MFVGIYEFYIWQQRLEFWVFFLVFGFFFQDNMAPFLLDNSEEGDFMFILFRYFLFLFRNRQILVSLDYNRLVTTS